MYKDTEISIYVSTIFVYFIVAIIAISCLSCMSKKPNLRDRTTKNINQSENIGTTTVVILCFLFGIYAGMLKFLT